MIFSHNGCVLTLCSCSKSFTLVNTCNVDIVFDWTVTLRTAEVKDFVVLPSHGTLESGTAQKITLDIKPSKAQKYNTTLMLGMPGIGNQLCSIPIFADCLVPQITSDQTMLTYGKSFLHHSARQLLTLRNQSSLQGRFKILDQV